MDYSRFIGNDTAEELLAQLLRQFIFWCENGISNSRTWVRELPLFYAPLEIVNKTFKALKLML